MIKILHTADWHPRSDGMLAGKPAIDPDTGLARTLTDFRQSLQWIYNLIMEQQVDLVLLAGDIFDTSKPSVDELNAVLEWLKAIPEQIPVVVISGNHDINQNGAAASAVSPGIHLGRPHVITRPETVELTITGHRVRIDCLPYPSRGRLIANLKEGASTPEGVNGLVNQALHSIINGFTMEHDTADAAEIRILLAHGSVDRCKVNDQPRSLAHDVLIPVGAFENSYDLIALGHIHQRQTIGTRAFYPGSLLRNSFGEEKEEKGVNIYQLALAGKPDGGLWSVNIFDNPHARAFKTIDVARLREEPLPMDLGVVYRIKGEVSELEWAELKGVWTFWMEAVPYLQIDVELTRGDRARDSQMSRAMSIDDALDRTIEREGILDPLASKIRELHRELVHEVSP